VTGRAGKDIETIRIHGHVLHGRPAELRAFRHLAVDTQNNLFREVAAYGSTRVMLNDTAWEIIRRQNHSYEISPPGGRVFI
jgi:hypothetical protein